MRKYGKCKIGVSLSISGEELYKSLHLRFKRAVTIVDTTLIKICIHPQNWWQTLWTIFFVYLSKGLLNMYQTLLLFGILPWKFMVAISIPYKLLRYVGVSIIWFVNLLPIFFNEFIQICYYLALNMLPSTSVSVKSFMQSLHSPKLIVCVFWNQVCTCVES